MYLFTSEAVSAGHPDKCADIIADTIVDTILQNDADARIASEVFVAGKNIAIGGEVTTKNDLTNEDYHNIIRKALINIGYTGNGGFDRKECLYPDDIEISNFLNRQSPDINQGVDQEDGEIGAGDQGLMFGYACAETDEYMPQALTYARQLCDTIYQHALSHPDTLGVDIKTQVTIDYGNKSNFEQAIPGKIHTIVASAPSQRDMDITEARTLIMDLIQKSGLKLESDTIIHINPTGRYVNHSPLYDSGLTGRKLIVDSFGGYAPIGGGAQSSKDYTKVDRSGLYAGRWIAKQIVAAGLSKKALVQLSYAIGVAKPVSVSVDMMGTALVNIDDETLSNLVHKRYSLTPKWITDRFDLSNPKEGHFLYADVAARGQVGFSDYPWEKLDDVDYFKSLIK
jgi:S-adenosylmethionine synthetase